MRRRVLVIGGGMAGLTTAHELSRTARLRSEWDVQVVEMGHKIGGRLASAHRPERWGRNEEHGLHVWFGWYDNTFRLAEEVWKAWPRPNDCPWDTIWDGLRPIWISDHGLSGPRGLEVRRAHHPRNSDPPGRGTKRTPSGHVTSGLDLARALLSTWQGIVLDRASGNPAPGRLGRLLWPSPLDTTPLRALARRLEPWFERLAATTARTASVHRRAIGRHVERSIASVHHRVVRSCLSRAGDDLGARALVHTLDLLLAVLRGVSSPRHGILEDGDLDRVSAWELGAWLALHGAAAETIAHSALLEALYDMPFAFQGGDRDRRVLEASTALRFTYRLLTGYKHAPAYLLDAGAGETIVAPLHELLRARGVRFRPFHRLVRMELNPTRTRVERLVFVRAARVRGDYDPLVTRRGLRGFRAEPDWSQLHDGDQLRARGVDFYSRFGDRGERVEITLERGRDFDDVVLALPLGCIKPDADGHTPVRAWLDAHAPARACIERLHLVPTLAAQLWLRDSPERVGLHGRAVVTWARPFSVVCDMTPVIAHEAWPTPRPGSCAYLCGAWPSQSVGAPSSNVAARRADDDEARRLLVEQMERHGRTLFTQHASLHEPPGATAWEAQYVRANVEPWDLADLALPGADPVRLEATGSGLSNLALAGSWVRTPVNSTSVEAAVCSGIAAARALGAEVREIFGEHLLRTPSKRLRLPGRHGELHHARFVDAQFHTESAPQNAVRRRSSDRVAS